MAVHAAGQHQVHIFLEGIGGQGDDGHGAGVGPVHGANGLGRGIAVHFGHLQIHQNQVVEILGRLGEHGHGFRSVTRLVNIQTQMRELLNDDDAVDFHVIRQQNALARELDRTRAGPGFFFRAVFRFLEPEGEGKVAALALGARHADFSAHMLDDALADGKPEARAAVGAGNVAAALLKGLEQRFEHFVGYAHAVVPHEEGNQPFPLPFVLLPYPEMDLPEFRRELGRIAQQVDQYLAQAQRVRLQIRRVLKTFHGNREGDVFFIAAGADDVLHTVHQLVERETVLAQFNSARLNFGDIQNVVEQTQQMP